jgi:hypothetical protein
MLVQTFLKANDCCEKEKECINELYCSLLRKKIQQTINKDIF